MTKIQQMFPIMHKDNCILDQLWTVQHRLQSDLVSTASKLQPLTQSLLSVLQSQQLTRLISELP